MGKSKVRNSNFELLRIVAMFMIIIFHIVKWLFYKDGGLGKEWYSTFQGTGTIYVVAVIRQFFGWGGNLLFAMISGYFLIGRTQTVARIGKLVVNVYGLMLFGLVAVCGCFMVFRTLDVFPGELTLNIKSAFYMNNFWYLQAYALFLLLLPLFNKKIMEISQASYLGLIAISYLVFENLNLPTNIFVIDDGVRYIWLGFIIGGFLKRFDLFKNTKLIALIIGMVLPVAVYGGLLFGYRNIMMKDGDFHDTSYLYIIFATFIFAIFMKLDLKNQLINVLGKTISFVFVFQIMAKSLLIANANLVMASGYGIGIKVLLLIFLSLLFLLFAMCLGVLYQPIADVVKKMGIKLFNTEVSFK